NAEGMIRLRRSARLERMDRVRFGRALGYGARHAAKTLTEAAAAASAPSSSHAPSSSQKTSTGGTSRPGVENPARPPRPVVTRATVERRAAETLDQLRTTSKQARRASGSLLHPVKRFSSVLWLQVTGTFFALMAATTGIGAWRLRGALHKSMDSHEAMKLYLCLFVFAVFTYFTVSSFVRAERR
ncbi:MAG TPA: hypothetical protein VIJ65_07855, partial [Acidobacteriaceae bacterium]